MAKQKLVLARAIGLPLGQQFEITTQVAYQELTPSSLDEAIQSAYKARADFQSQMNQVRSAELARKAASAERYPTIGAETDYGLSGVNPGSSHGTVDAAATLRIPIFQGGRVHGDVLRADASLPESKDSGWKTCEPRSTRRFATLISTWKQLRRKCPSRKAR